MTVGSGWPVILIQGQADAAAEKEGLPRHREGVKKGAVQRSLPVAAYARRLTTASESGENHTTGPNS